MKISEILEQMEDLIDKAWNLPLSGGKCLVPLDEIQELIDKIRVNLPKEIKQSMMIVTDRNDIISDAKKEAEAIISDAEKISKKMIENSEIVKKAKDEANSITIKANARINELKKTTNEYVDKILFESENILNKNLQEIKSAHKKLKNINKN